MMFRVFIGLIFGVALANLGHPQRFAMSLPNTKIDLDAGTRRGFMWCQFRSVAARSRNES